MIATPKRTRDLTGQRFGHLLAISYAGKYVSPSGHTIPLWLCRCDCGNEKVVYVNYLRNKIKVPSCGCHFASRTHGMSDSDTYSCWRSMNRRCHEQSNASYADYGGRGITVCDRWRHSFEDFLADMGPRPSPKHSIDRYPNQNGNYEPGNCRWATSVEQNNNMRSNRNLTYNGETLSVSQWAKRIGINVQTLWERIQSGWSVERALTEPKHTCGPRR